MISKEKLQAGLALTLTKTELPGFDKRMQGKVRDSYLKGGKRLIVTTDRISAFDRVLGTLPYKGQVLNRVAAFWFEKTRDFAPNHMIGNRRGEKSVRNSESIYTPHTGELRGIHGRPLRPDIPRARGGARGEKSQPILDYQFTYKLYYADHLFYPIFDP